MDRAGPPPNATHSVQLAVAVVHGGAVRVARLWPETVATLPINRNESEREKWRMRRRYRKSLSLDRRSRRGTGRLRTNSEMDRGPTGARDTVTGCPHSADPHC